TATAAGTAADTAAANSRGRHLMSLIGAGKPSPQASSGAAAAAAAAVAAAAAATSSAGEGIKGPAAPPGDRGGIPGHPASQGGMPPQPRPQGQHHQQPGSVRNPGGPLAGPQMTNW
ncbi:unnamed protein product, partial [Ectocarpus fasciculatus]